MIPGVCLRLSHHEDGVRIHTMIPNHCRASSGSQHCQDSRLMCSRRLFRHTVDSLSIASGENNTMWRQNKQKEAVFVKTEQREESMATWQDAAKGLLAFEFDAADPTQESLGINPQETDPRKNRHRRESTVTVNALGDQQSTLELGSSTPCKWLRQQVVGLPKVLRRCRGLIAHLLFDYEWDSDTPRQTLRDAAAYVAAIELWSITGEGVLPLRGARPTPDHPSEHSCTRRRRAR